MLSKLGSLLMAALVSACLWTSIAAAIVKSMSYPQLGLLTACLWIVGCLCLAPMFASFSDEGRN